MTDKLPPQMMRFFAPGPPLPFLPPVDVQPELRRNAVVTPMAPFVAEMRTEPDPDYVPTKTLELLRVERVEQKKARALAERERQEREYADSLKSSTSLTDDAFKTVFIARLAKAVDEDKLRATFETYGPLKQVKMVHNPATNNRRPYAFIEYHSEHDVKGAVRSADGMKLEGVRMVVDVERGRTVTGWLPRRLGGGIGPGKNAIKTPPTSAPPSEIYRREPSRYGPPPPRGGDPRRGGGYDGPRDRDRGGYDRYDRPPPRRSDNGPSYHGEPPRKRSRDRYRSRSRSPKRRDDRDGGYRGSSSSYRR